MDRSRLRSVLGNVKSSSSLIVADFSARNFERLESFQAIAEKTSRELVVPSKDILMCKPLLARIVPANQVLGAPQAPTEDVADIAKILSDREALIARDAQRLIDKFVMDEVYTDRGETPPKTASASKVLL